MRSIVLGLCSVSVFLFIFGRYGIQDYQAMHREINGLNGAIAQAEQAIKTTKKATRAWNTDDVERQRCLRQDFYMCCTNELIYRV